jgi:hypothetical protein
VRASEAGLEQAQLSFTHTWIEGKSYRVGFASRPTNPVQHEGCLGIFECVCVRTQLQCPYGSYNLWHCRGNRKEAVVTLRNTDCPVHCPDTSKEIREELERLARRHRNLTGSARELYQKQQVTYSNGIVSADPVAALERAREARDATREAWDRMQEVSGRNARAAGSGPTASSGPAAVDPPETSTQIAFVEVD